MSDSPKEQQVSEPDLSGTYTARDYLRWKMDELVELIRGKIVKMSPSPSSNHQRISHELTGQFWSHFRSGNCEVFKAPYDIYLTDDPANYKATRNIIQPDLCVICGASKIKSFGCVGAPDLIVEILSPATARKDQKDKLELYREFGVQEYWIVSPENRNAFRLNLEGSTYHTSGPYTEGQTADSVVFPDLALDLTEVFKNVEDPSFE